MKNLTFSIRSITVGTKELIRESDFSINLQEKVGLIGRNGSGKSTLIQIVLSSYYNRPVPEDIEFSGKIFISPEIKIAYLPQEIKFQFAGTVEEYLSFCGGEFFITSKRFKELSEKEKLSEEELVEYFEIIDKMNQFDLWDYESRKEMILQRLRINPDILRRNIQEISGGEATKITLAGVLLSDANFWIFDEPTNNLDKDSIDLLFEEMEKFKGGILYITHDRRLLNISTKIFEIDEETKRVITWGGNYEFYRKKKQEEFEARQRRYEEQEKRRRRQLQEDIKRLKQKAQNFEKISGDAFHRARGAKLAKRAKASAGRIERELTKLPEPKPPEKSEFPSPQIEVQKGNILRIENLSYSLENNENKTLFSIKDLLLNAGERLLIEGPNGSGKTTLLKIIVGQKEPTSGLVIKREGIKIGYLPQTPSIKDNNQKVFEFLEENYGLSKEEVKHILGLMKIPHAFNLPLKILSIGEIRRIQIASILFQNPELLVLDEPTNHLDIYTIEDLVEVLKNYRGTIIFVSHDETFIEDLKPSKIISLK